MGKTVTPKLELDCMCGSKCHRVAFDFDIEGNLLFISIAERKRGRPNWHEVVLNEDNIKELMKLVGYIGKI